MNDPKPIGQFSTTQLARFWSRVEKQESCWIWKGCLNRDGYGDVKVAGQMYRVHRVAYTVHKGEIPPRLVIDHLCRNRACVNPDHLEAVTNLENISRGFPGRRKTRPGEERTHCKSGHAIIGENAMPTRLGYLTCRKCNREYMREYMRNRRLRSA